MLGYGKQLLLNGEFHLNASQTLPSGSLIGSYGNGATIYADGDIGTLFNISGQSNVTIKDLKLKLSGSNNAIETGTSANNILDNILLLRVSITDGNGAAFFGDGIFLVDSEIVNSVQSNVYASASRLALLGNTFDRSQQSHNLYLSTVDRGVIESNNVWKPSYVSQSGRLNMRIGANNATSRSVTVTDNDFDSSTTGIASVQFAISSGSWDSTLHAENILFERNNVRGIYGLLWESGDYRNTTIRYNALNGGDVFSISKSPFIPDNSGYNGPRGVWFHDNNITTTGYWFSNTSTSSQNVYVYHNTVNGTCTIGNLPPGSSLTC